MTHTKQDPPTPLIWKASTSKFVFYLPTSFLHFKLVFCFKRQKQESPGDGNIITTHLFHSNLNDIFGGLVDGLPPAVISSCCCNKIFITQIYSLIVLEVGSPTWSH